MLEGLSNKASCSTPEEEVISSFGLFLKASVKVLATVMNTYEGTIVTAVWRNIDTAPKDGTVIITDEGTGCYVDQRHWGSPVTNGWYLCAFDCQPELSYECCFGLEPKSWLDFGC